MRFSASALGAVAFCASSLAFTSPAAAQLVPSGPIVTIDENMNGTVTAPGTATITLTAAFGTDPGPGGRASILSYTAPAGYIPVVGDVVLQDLVNDRLVTSDVIRFNPVAAAAGVPARVFFYSGIEDNLDNIGDAGLPTAFYDNRVVLREVGLEGIGDGAVYTPTANQPGFIPGLVVTYRFISDSAVPEPASWAMMILGLGGLGVVMKRTRSKRALPQIA